MRAIAVLAAVLLLVPLGAAQAPEGFVLLGEDPAGDASSPDTLFDINALYVHTVGSDLVFFLGLEGDTSEAATMCPAVGFQFGGKDYLPVDCFECAAFQCTNAVSDARPPSSSRGENVASNVELGGGGATLTVPLDAIGASVGDTIDAIYGLTYQTRALSPSDALPDGKMSSSSDDTLGSYTIGGDGPDAPDVTYAELDEPVVSESFEESTSATHVFNVSVELGSAHVGGAIVVSNGTVVVKISDAENVLIEAAYTADGELNETFEDVAAGAWSIELVYDQFIGSVDLEVAEPEEEGGNGNTTATSTNGGNTTQTNGGNGTTTTDGNGTAPPTTDSDDSPAVWLPLVLIGIAVMALRRRR